MRQLRNFRGSGEDRETTVNAEKYSGMNEAQLMRELESKVVSAKESGSFSAEQLDDFVRFVSPSLDESTRARLDELVKTIKGI